MDFLSRPTACGTDGAAPAIRYGRSSSTRVWPWRARLSRGAGWTPAQTRRHGLATPALSTSWCRETEASSLGHVSAAKNSLAVGAVRDGGALALFSSRGPTADGRLRRRSSPRRRHTVARGRGQPGRIRDRFRYQFSGARRRRHRRVADGRGPAYRSRRRWPGGLMASAIKPDPWLDAAGRFPASNTAGPGDLQSQYGLGRASARTAC